jgi:hypothetical protein
MQKINTGSSLREAIIRLEIKRADEEKALREQLHVTYESMKPINVVKNLYNEVAASESLKDNLVNTSVGLVIGYLSKALFERVSHSPVRKLIGTVILFGITNAVRKNPEAVKSMASGLFKVVRSGINAAANRADRTESEPQLVIIKER